MPCRISTSVLKRLSKICQNIFTWEEYVLPALKIWRRRSMNFPYRSVSAKNILWLIWRELSATFCQDKPKWDSKTLKFTWINALTIPWSTNGSEIFYSKAHLTLTLSRLIIKWEIKSPSMPSVWNSRPNLESVHWNTLLKPLILSRLTLNLQNKLLQSTWSHLTYFPHWSIWAPQRIRKNSLTKSTKKSKIWTNFLKETMFKKAEFST